MKPPNPFLHQARIFLTLKCLKLELEYQIFYTMKDVERVCVPLDDDDAEQFLRKQRSKFAMSEDFVKTLKLEYANERLVLV